MKKLILSGILALSLTALGAAHKPAPKLKPNPKPKATPEQAAPTADVVLRNGQIYTMDAARSWAESIAVKDGKIVYVGDDDGVKQWIGPSTETIKLAGHFVLPGFIDAHVHPVEAGVGLDRCDLSEKRDKAAVLAAIKEYAEAHPDAKWIVGQGWQLPVFPQANPKKEWLDAIDSDRPIYMTAADGHSAWASSKALEIAGITKSTPDPANGRIERDASGNPTGTLRESATDLVYKMIPPPTLEEGVAGLHHALQIMNGFGITGFEDASVSIEGVDPAARGALTVYDECDKRGLLTAHVTTALYADPEGSVEHVLDQVPKFKKLREDYRGKHFHVTAVKIFADGVIEANTAALLQPYLDKGDAGDLNWGQEKLDPFVEELDKAKFQLHFHAIGDRAIRVVLNALEAARTNNGVRDARPLMAHLELIDPNDIPRFARLHVVPLFQPLWAYADTYIKDLTVPKLGDARMRWIYPMRSVSVTGATMAMGSDWNVSSVNPLDGIEVAVTRQDPDGPDSANSPFIPEERLDLRTALAAYTIGSAYATFHEKDSGSIEPGKFADIIVLSDNLFNIPPSHINQTKVILTFLEGKLVYRSESMQ